MRSCESKINSRVDSRKISFRLESDNIVESVVELDGSCLLKEAIDKSGIRPRDGSLVYALDHNGEPLNNLQSISRVPPNLLVGTGKKICQVWGEKWANNLGEASHNTHGNIIVPDLQVGEYSNVFVVDLEGENGLKYGYKFSDSEPAYAVRSMVYVQIPRDGNTVLLFNPETGTEDIEFQLTGSDLENIRGHWGCCEIKRFELGGLSELRLRNDLTQLSGLAHAKPRINNKVEKNKTVIKNYQSSDPDSMIGYGEVGHHKAIVFGSPSLETGTEFGVIACLANNDKSALVNLPGYRYGMSQIIRVPAEGREVDLYHEKEGKSYSCTILQKPEHDLELLRNRWVVAKLQRHRKYKRAFEIIGLPDEFC